jgi:hypothetical protein
MMPHLNLNDPKIIKRIERGRKIAMKFWMIERKILEKGEKDRTAYEKLGGLRM